MFKIRSKAVIHELLDNEIILADLDSGTYYSIRGSGIPVWQLLLCGYSLDAITALFRGRYGADHSDALGHFVDLLVNEQLLIPDAEEKEACPPPSVLWPEQFDLPFFEKYEEMKELLMLDPIHEVDEQGWPARSQTP